MKKLLKRWMKDQAGFTLIELLVVIAILGVLAAVAVPNVGKFIGQGKQESYNAELHNLQTGVMAMLAESVNGSLDQSYSGISDMSTVTADGGPLGTLHLDTYMSGLETDGTVKTGCTYDIEQDGHTILQSTP